MRASKRDGMIVVGAVDGTESRRSMMRLGSFVGAQILKDREIGSGDPRAWCVFVNEVGVTILHGAPADDPGFADIILDVRKRLEEVEVVPAEQLQAIPEHVAL